MQYSYRKTFIGFLLLITLLTGPLAGLAQKTGGVKTVGTVAANTGAKDAKGECKGNYSGVVNYTRRIKTAHTGKFGSAYNREYVYNSQIIVSDNGKTQGTIYKEYNGIGGSFNFMGKANATLTENLTDQQNSEKDEYCTLSLKGAGGKTRVKCQGLFQRNIQASGTGDVNVFLGFRGDKYKISLDNTPVNGSGNESSKSSCTGTCTPNKPINHSRALTITNDRPAGTYTDEMPLDINNLNRISGTFTRTSGDETVTITWNLARCAPPMQIDNLRFEHYVFPDSQNWRGVDKLTGTTDGNLVKVKATVFNNTGATGYANVKFTEKDSGLTLPNNSVSVSVQPGESRDVEYLWDTSGYAWDDKKSPLSNREIKATIEGGESVTDRIKIRPKPIVMAHGLWSNETAWANYPGFMRAAHSNLWQGYAVGNDPEHGKMSTGHSLANSDKTNSVYQNAQELAKQIKYARELNNAWHLDIVAHSMGGLISRQYIHSFMPEVFDGKPAVTHLVMLGTPNMGSPCADTVDELFVQFGKMDMEAMRELRPSVVRAFNSRVTNRKDVKFSVMIGWAANFTCLDYGADGDGVVPWQSARYNITDHDFVIRLHTEMAGREDFIGFVLPRVAIGPKRAMVEHQTAWFENAQDDNYARSLGYGDDANPSFMHKASYKTSDAAADKGPKLSMAEKVELAANETKTIDFAVTDGNYAGILLVATPAVQATLIDASGAVVGQNKGGMEALKEIFRTIEVRKQFAAAMWKLKLENLGNVATTVMVGGRSATSVAGGFKVEAGKATAAGIVPLKATWSENGSPVLNAKITAQVSGASQPVTFFDDGKHNDGAAGDGVYGAATEKLEGGNYSVMAKAEANGKSLETVAVFNVGAEAKATAIGAKPKPALARPATRKKN